jgi:hypothetical protein
LTGFLSWLPHQIPHQSPPLTRQAFSPNFFLKFSHQVSNLSFLGKLSTRFPWSLILLILLARLLYMLPCEAFSSCYLSSFVARIARRLPCSTSSLTSFFSSFFIQLPLMLPWYTLFETPLRGFLRRFPHKASTLWLLHQASILDVIVKFPLHVSSSGFVTRISHKASNLSPLSCVSLMSFKFSICF